MDTGNIITIGFFFAGLIGQAAYLKGVFGTKIQQHDAELLRQDSRVSDLTEKVVFKDACQPRHSEVDRRFDRLEIAQNSEKKK